MLSPAQNKILDPSLYRAQNNIWNKLLYDYKIHRPYLILPRLKIIDIHLILILNRALDS